MSAKVQKTLAYDEEYHMIDEEVFDATKWGTRHIQCLILFVTLTIACSMRSCVTVALVAMTKHDTGQSEERMANSAVLGNSSEENHGNHFKPNGVFNALLLTPPHPQLDWSKKMQDTVVSSFYWGYMVLQIPAGQLAYKFGARYLLFAALIINFVISLIFPVVAFYGGWSFALVSRIIQGLSQACIYPSIHTVLGKWSPVEDRGRMSSVIYRGQALGVLLGFSLSGFIASSPLGWPGIFWFYGSLSGCFAIFIWFYLSDSPAEHKTISPAERTYIEFALRQNNDQKQLSVPWKSILTSKGMIAIVIAHVGMSWCHLMLYVEVPAYMDKVMGVNIKVNGLLTALPFIMMFVMHFFFSWLTDMIIVKKYLNVTQTRKFANTLGNVPAAIGFFILAYAPKDIYVVEGILVVICGIKVSDHLGFFINHIDISPNFAGVMMSLSNFMANFVGSFAPIICGLMLTDATDKHQWRNVFLISGGIYFFSNLAYLILGTAEQADWNDPKQYETVALSDNLLVEVKEKNNADVEKKIRKVNAHQ